MTSTKRARIAGQQRAASAADATPKEMNAAVWRSAWWHPRADWGTIRERHAGALRKLRSEKSDHESGYTGIARHDGDSAKKAGVNGVTTVAASSLA